MKLHSRISNNRSGADVIFSLRDAADIFQNVGDLRDPSRLPEFAERLNGLAETYLVDRHTQSTEVPPSTILKQLNNIESAARRLLKTFSLSINSNVDDVPMDILARLRRGGRVEQVRSMLLGIQELVRRTEEEKRFPELNRSKERRGPPHKADEALNKLFGSLIRLYLDAFERLPEASFNISAEQGGGDIPFFSMCIKKFRENLSDEQKEFDRKLVKDLTKTPEAIRARLRTIQPCALANQAGLSL